MKARKKAFRVGSSAKRTRKSSLSSPERSSNASKASSYRSSSCWVSVVFPRRRSSSFSLNHIHLASANCTACSFIDTSKVSALHSLRRLSRRDARSASGGEGGIRTHEPPCGRLHDFRSWSFGHSDTSPLYDKLCRKTFNGEGEIRTLEGLTALPL